MWIYIWLAVTAVALIVEFVTTELVSVWFIGGGLVAMLLSGLGLEWYFHVPAFIIVSIALMLCFRSFVMRKLKGEDVKTNAETAIGKEYELIDGISFNTAGSIKINGVIWSAVSENEDALIPSGTKVVVKRIEGNKYIVEEK